MDKEKNKSKLVLLHGIKNEEEIILTDEEKELKQKLLNIESKLDSISKVLESIAQERPDALFSDDVFNTIVGTIAIGAASDVISEYLDVKKEQK